MISKVNPFGLALLVIFVSKISVTARIIPSQGNNALPGDQRDKTSWKCLNCYGPSSTQRTTTFESESSHSHAHVHLPHEDEDKDPDLEDSPLIESELEELGPVNFDEEFPFDSFDPPAAIRPSIPAEIPEIPVEVPRIPNIEIPEIPIFWKK